MNSETILKLFEKYWSSLDPNTIKRVMSLGKDLQFHKPGIGPFEWFLVHFYTLEENPNFAFEMGTRGGFSTYSIAAAMQMLGKKNSFVSTEVRC